MHELSLHDQNAYGSRAFGFDMHIEAIDYNWLMTFGYGICGPLTKMLRG